MALGVLKVIVLLWVIVVTRLVALMIQLGNFVGGGGIPYINNSNAICT